MELSTPDPWWPVLCTTSRPSAERESTPRWNSRRPGFFFNADADTAVTVSGGAGIDVLAVEPPTADHPLLADDLPNLIVTPHIAWAAREARQRAVDSTGGNGFMTVAATHAALLMAQGGGRLIRSLTDRGVLAVLDSRLATARYGGFIRASMTMGPE